MAFLSKMFGPSLPEVKVNELHERLKVEKDLFVLDVREMDEYTSGHIQGAMLIPLGQLGGKLKSLPQDREIICVCASGSRSFSAASMLRSSGLNAINMSGGMFTWQYSGLPVKTGK
ncbi:MAG: rhodanese-like domain-containing protein [Chloroflexota bacterium]